jgi:uracil-DNA glycosylase family 4
MTRRELAAHIRLFADLGVTGVSRDRTWRARGDDSTGVDATLQRSTEDEAGPVASTGAGAAAHEASHETLGQIRTDLGDCARCALHAQGRRQIVFGVGNPQADLMFVGEAPGADEDVKGEPFVGRAGQLLTRIIEAIDLKRDQVYIANVIKCRPPRNRNPEPAEVAECEPFLFRQIDSIRPRVIVALGAFAAHALLRTDAPISRLRGRVHEFRGGIKLVPTFHPAFLLRSPDRKRDVWEDMKNVRALLAESD